MKLTDEVASFIEDNIDLIEANNWDQIYDNAKFNLDSESTGGFTKAMLDSGIDPLIDGVLDYIPDYYLSDQAIETFIIPDTIHLLSEGCFSYSHIKFITIPESVKEISPYVFYECGDLQEVIILGKDVLTSSQAFMYCSKDDLVIKCYKGSSVDDQIAEWEDGWRVEYL